MTTQLKIEVTWMHVLWFEEQKMRLLVAKTHLKSKFSPANTYLLLCVISAINSNFPLMCSETYYIEMGSSNNKSRLNMSKLLKNYFSYFEVLKILYIIFIRKKAKRICYWQNIKYYHINNKFKWYVKRVTHHYSSL